MPDENDDQLVNGGASENISNQHNDGSEAQKQAEDQEKGEAGPVNNADKGDVTNATAKENTEPPEEEMVGARRPEPRVVRKMSAADFRIRPEAKPEQKPEATAQKMAPPEPAKPSASEQESMQTPTTEPPAETAIQRPKPEYKAEPERKVEQKPTIEPVQEIPQERKVEQKPTIEPVQEIPQERKEEPQPSAQPLREESKMEPVNIQSGHGGIEAAIKGILSFFTIFKLNVGEREIEAMNKNFYLAPFAGFIIGMIASVIGFIFSEVGLASITVIAIFATIFLLSKFIHFDGLADFGDGLIANGSKEDHVRALKDTHIGAGGFGVALIVTLLSIAALSGIFLPAMIAIVVVTMEVFAKNAIVSAAAFGEPGNGMASEQVRSADTQTLLMSTAISVGLAFGAYVVLGVIVSVISGPGMFALRPFITAVAIILGAAAVSILTGWLMAYFSNRHFGFVNGDVLGATNEISRVFILMVSTLVVVHYMLPGLVTTIWF